MATCAKPNVVVLVEVEAACDLHANALRERIAVAMERMLNELLPTWEAQVAVQEHHGSRVH